MSAVDGIGSLSAKTTTSKIGFFIIRKQAKFRLWYARADRSRRAEDFNCRPREKFSFIHCELRRDTSEQTKVWGSPTHLLFTSPVNKRYSMIGILEIPGLENFIRDSFLGRTNADVAFEESYWTALSMSTSSYDYLLVAYYLFISCGIIIPEISQKMLTRLCSKIVAEIWEKNRFIPVCIDFARCRGFLPEFQDMVCLLFFLGETMAISNDIYLKWNPENVCLWVASRKSY